jgi:hypothetical protein
MGASSSQPVSRAFENEKQVVARQMGTLSLRDTEGEYFDDENDQRVSILLPLLGLIADCIPVRSPSLCCQRKGDDDFSGKGKALGRKLATGSKGTT